MKPILFNTDMVRALLEGRKTVTRRVVKPLCGVDIPLGKQFFVSPRSGAIYWKGEDRQLLIDGKLVAAPYCPGDILYVREKWCSAYDGEKYFYFADKCTPREERKLLDYDNVRWRPSIHMPREAARLFLRVTGVRVEKLQDITDEDLVRDFDFCQEAINAVGRDVLAKPFWNSTIKPAYHALYGWDADPWVWVIEFERISKEEAERC